MTLWGLWRGLKQPAYDHPVFRRVQADVYDDTTPMSRMAQHILLQGQIWLWPLLFIVDMRLVCLMALSGTICGMILSVRISSQISGEQHQHTFDLLCLTPGGTLRTIWAICMGSLHREQAFEILNSGEAWIVRLGLFVPFIVSSQLLLERLFGLKNGLTLVWGIGFVILYYIDHVQAIVFGCLAGMLTTGQSASLDKRLWAMMIFAGFQLGSYFVTAVICLVIAPALYLLSDAIGMNGEIMQVIVAVIVFYVVRERIISLGWQHLMNVTNTEANEADFLTTETTYPRFNLHEDAQTVARA